MHALGTALAVPPFSSLRRVQDKAAQAATLAELELPHPHTAVAHDMRELRAIARPPVFVKAPIGTASSGVRLIRDAAALEDVRCPVVVQAPLDGPLTMIQAVYDHGRLVAWHACLRERLGVSGGAAVKRSIRPAGVAAHLERLGSALQWHGALSLDAILTAHGPSYIDVNPRLVEPANAWHAGIDLVGLLVAVSLGRHPPPAPPAREGVRTHQLLLAVLGAAEGGGRRAIARELILASTRRGPYADSTEELTPIHNDPLAAAPVAAAALATLVRPAAWRRFAGDAAANYALTPQAWSWISRTTR